MYENTNVEMSHIVEERNNHKGPMGTAAKIVWPVNKVGSVVWALQHDPEHGPVTKMLRVVKQPTTTYWIEMGNKANDRK